MNGAITAKDVAVDYFRNSSAPDILSDAALLVGGVALTAALFNPVGLAVGVAGLASIGLGTAATIEYGRRGDAKSALMSGIGIIPGAVGVKAGVRASRVISSARLNNSYVRTTAAPIRRLRSDMDLINDLVTTPIPAYALAGNCIGEWLERRTRSL